MPDGQGRYLLSEMEDRVSRLLKQVQAVVNTATRVESSTVYPSQAFSNTDIDQQINSSLVALYTEMIAGREDQFSQTSFVSILASNPGPYNLPINMIQLRYLEWLPPGAPSLPNSWLPMIQVDDPIARQVTFSYPAPTWKFASNGTAFLLNQNQSVPNANGVRVEAVILPPELVNPTDVITTVDQWVRVFQQAVIYDAATVLAISRRLPAAAELEPRREEWHQRIVLRQPVRPTKTEEPTQGD